MSMMRSRENNGTVAAYDCAILNVQFRKRIQSSTLYDRGARTEYIG